MCAARSTSEQYADGNRQRERTTEERGLSSQIQGSNLSDGDSSSERPPRAAYCVLSLVVSAGLEIQTFGAFAARRELGIAAADRPR